MGGGGGFCRRYARAGVSGHMPILPGGGSRTGGSGGYPRMHQKGSIKGGPVAVRQAVGGGCQSSWGRLLSVTNAIEAGAWRQGDGSWCAPWRDSGGTPPPFLHSNTPLGAHGGTGEPVRRVPYRRRLRLETGDHEAGDHRQPLHELLRHVLRAGGHPLAQALPGHGVLQDVRGAGPEPLVVLEEGRHQSVQRAGEDVPGHKGTPQCRGRRGPTPLPLDRAALEGGGGTPPLLLQGAQPMPSHGLRDAKCQLQWHLQPTVTATNRFGNLLQPPV